MSTSTTEIVQRYRLISIFYDVLWENILALGKGRNPRQVLADRIPDQPLRILDLCSGTGNGSLSIGKAHAQNQIIGVDLSPAMLAIASSKIRQQRISNLALHQMNVARLGFAAAEFDVVMVSFGLHDVGYEVMLDILRESHRVLKTGGQLYIVDYAQEGGWLQQKLFSAYIRASYPARVRAFLAYDWQSILAEVGFDLQETEICFISKLIWAEKNGNKPAPPNPA